jgi:SprT-like family
VIRPFRDKQGTSASKTAKRQTKGSGTQGKFTLWEVSRTLEKPDGLQRLFEEYNRRYFGGELRNLPVAWSATVMRRYHAIGRLENDLINPTGIAIAKRIRGLDVVVGQTLLHEMVHLALHRTNQMSGHGEAFQREMLRLATIGAFEGLW